MSEVQKNYTEQNQSQDNFYSKRLEKYRFSGTLELKESEIFNNSFLSVVNEIIINNDKNNIGEKGLFTEDFSVNKIHKNTYTVSNGINSIILEFSKKYSCIRIYSNLEYDHLPLNFYIKSKTLEIYNANKLSFKTSKLLLTLRDLGIIYENIPMLSINRIKKQFKEANEIEGFINKINNKQKPSLVFENAEKLIPNKTHLVFQKEGIIINEPKEGEALYTYGAGPCSIIIIKDKDTGKIGLAHISGGTSKISITSFISYFSNPDITLVSGDLRISRTIIEAIGKELRNNISYFNKNESWDKIQYSMGIKMENGDLKILYGYNNQIKDSEQNEELRDLMMFKSKNLSIKIK